MGWPKTRLEAEGERRAWLRPLKLAAIARRSLCVCTRYGAASVEVIRGHRRHAAMTSVRL